MQILDRTIAALSPRWGLSRMMHRQALEAARAFDAAKVGRRTQGWIAPDSAVNSEIAGGAARVRARARDLVRNNAWAGRAVSIMTAKICGTGIMPRLQAGKGARERKQAALDYWNRFVETADPEGRLDFYGLQRLAVRTWQESGEALIRFHARPASWRLAVPLQIEVMEGDYLDAGKTETLRDGGCIIQGVEYDAAGRRVAYWLHDDHPGESLISFARASMQSRRVPAAEIIHLFETLRPGQARGVSPFASVAMRLRDVDDYEDAEIVRKKIGAALAAFVKRPSGPTASPLSSAATEASGARVETFRPGTVQYLAAGEEVTFSDPPSTEGYVEYMRMQLHAVAAGIGTTYGQLTGDMSQANYSSMRGGLLDFADILDGHQYLTVIPIACRPIWNRVAALAAATGARRPAEPWPALWTPPRRRMLDQTKEVAAKRDEIRLGLVGWREAVAENGIDPDEHIEEIAATNAELDARGIVMDGDPRRVTRAGVSQFSDPLALGETETETEKGNGNAG